MQICNKSTAPSSKGHTEKRKKFIAELNIAENDIVFVYSGGLHPWQRVEDSVELFERYYKQNPSSKLLILTGSQEQLKSL